MNLRVLEIVDDSVNAVMLDDKSDNSHKLILLASEVRIHFNFGSRKTNQFYSSSGLN